MLACIALYLNFSIVGFMVYESLFVIFVWWIRWSGGSYERGGANLYLVFYSFCLGFVLLVRFDLGVMSLIVSLIGFSKLPVFGLHIWLPKVHVEASMLGSMVLAGVVLKAGSVFCSWFCIEAVLLVLGVAVAAWMMLMSDGKVVMAYSSVAHMSCAVIIFGMLTMYGGYSHIVVSPLMFVAVYVGYLNSRARILSDSFMSTLLGGLLLFNLGFPILGAFYCEVVWFRKLGIMVMVFLLGYCIIGVVSMRIFYKIKRTEWMPWFTALMGIV